MVDLSTGIAVTISAMLLSTVLLGLVRGATARAACPLCGSRSSKHSERCPWHAHEHDDWS